MPPPASPLALTPSSPNLADTPSFQHLSTAAGKSVMMLPVAVVPNLWQCTAVVALPLAIFKVQQHAKDLENVPVIGPWLGSFIRYTPTLGETFSTSLPPAIVKVLAGSVVHKFGNNPVAENIFRDIAKIGSMAYAAYRNVGVGTSKYSYGWGNIISAVWKPACKAGVIAYNAPRYADGGIAANYLCEPSAHALLLVERDLQDINKTVALQANFSAYWTLAYTNANTTVLLIRSVAAIPSKAWAPSMFMSYGWVRLGLNTAVKTLFYRPFFSLQSWLMKFATGTTLVFDLGEGFYGHTKMAYQAGANSGRIIQLSVTIIPFFMHLTAITMVEFYNTYILMSLLRPVQFAADWATKEITDLIPDYMQPWIAIGGKSAILSAGFGCVATRFFAISITSGVALAALGPVIVAADEYLIANKVQSSHILSTIAGKGVLCLGIASLLMGPVPSFGICGAGVFAAWHYMQEENIPTTSETWQCQSLNAEHRQLVGCPSVVADQPNAN